jgi:hypothetical protein
MTPDEARLAMQHVQYLMSLLDSGKLNLAAQVFDPKGFWGIVIVNAADRESARVLLDGDPMVKANMFRGEVIPLRLVLEKPAEAAKPPAAVNPKTLESYSGTYKSDQSPLDIKAFVRDGKLFLQASGQPEFPLKAVSATQFEFALGRYCRGVRVLVQFFAETARRQLPIPEGGGAMRVKV